MKELKDICRIPVKFSEIDSMRRVWHGSYVTYMEDGRESFGRRYPGIGYEDIERSGIFAPLYDLKIRYYAPLRGRGWITTMQSIANAITSCVRRAKRRSCLLMPMGN